MTARGALPPSDQLRLNWAHPRMVPVGDGEVAVHIGGRGQPVLLLPGFPGSPRVFFLLAEALARDHYVILPHLPGTGASNRPFRSGYSVARNAKRLWMMCETLGARNLQIVGHDIGGAVAAWMAMEHVNNVRRLVLISTPLRRLSAGLVLERARVGTPVVSDLLFTAAAPAIVKRLYQQRVGPGFTIPDDELERAVSTWVPHPGRRIAVRYARALGNIQALRRFQRAWIRVPALLVYGAESPLLDRKSIDRTSDCFSRGRVKVVKGAGHCPLLERPAELSALIVRFLSGAHAPSAAGPDSVGAPPE